MRFAAGSFAGLAFVVAAVVVVPAFGAESLVASSAAVVPTDAAQPYTYQRFGAGERGAVTVALETGYGTRETRNFARPGLEQGASVRVQATDTLAVELFGGRLSEDGASQFSAEARYRAAEAEQAGVALDLGLGLTGDYRGDTIPRLRVAASRELGAAAWSASGNFEVPVGNPERDELDVMVALAGSLRATRTLRVGVELAGEDLEGLFDDEEAEGGAKLLAGPSVRLELPSDLYLQANLSAVYAVASDNPAAPPVGEIWGLSSRAVLGWQLP
jgi:hypothetical protein